MRGVDLRLFDFDYDLTWAALMMNHRGAVLGRYGGRDESGAETYLTLTGFKRALAAALDAHRRRPDAPAQRREVPFATVDAFPAAQRLKRDACIHCHQVYDFRREWLKEQGTWSRDQVWVFPPPRNVGLLLDTQRQNLLRDVLPDSPAAQAGLQAGDVLLSVGQVGTNSFADVQYALHQAGEQGPLAVRWQRGTRTLSGRLTLPAGWRESDISWRASMWGLSPPPCVHGQDLAVEEKRRLGLDPQQLAFRQGRFVPVQSRRAGIREGDIIYGIDGRQLKMTMLQFNVYVRLHFRPGDRIVFNVLRDGRRIEIPMVLPEKCSF